jgi:hypothetical protein
MSLISSTRASSRDEQAAVAMGPHEHLHSAATHWPWAHTSIFTLQPHTGHGPTRASSLCSHTLAMGPHEHLHSAATHWPCITFEHVVSCTAQGDAEQRVREHYWLHTAISVKAVGGTNGMRSTRTRRPCLSTFTNRAVPTGQSCGVKAPALEHALLTLTPL